MAISVTFYLSGVSVYAYICRQVSKEERRHRLRSFGSNSPDGPVHHFSEASEVDKTGRANPRHHFLGEVQMV